MGCKSGRMSKLMKDFSFWITADTVDRDFIFFNQEKEVLELHEVYQYTDIDVRTISEIGWFKRIDFYKEINALEYQQKYRHKSIWAASNDRYYPLIYKLVDDPWLTL